MVFYDARVHPHPNEESKPQIAGGRPPLVGDEASVRTISSSSQDSADRARAAQQSEDKARDAAVFTKTQAKLQVMRGRLHGRRAEGSCR